MLKKNYMGDFFFQKQSSRGILLETLFLKISQNSQENTSARVLFLIKLQTAPADIFLWIFTNS